MLFVLSVYICIYFIIYISTFFCDCVTVLVGTFINARCRQNPRPCLLVFGAQPHFLSESLCPKTNDASWLVSGGTLIISEAQRGHDGQTHVMPLRVNSGEPEGVWCRYSPKQVKMQVNAAHTTYTHTKHTHTPPTHAPAHTNTHQSTLQSLYSPC